VQTITRFGNAKCAALPFPPDVQTSFFYLSFISPNEQKDGDVFSNGPLDLSFFIGPFNFGHFVLDSLVGLSYMLDYYFSHPIYFSRILFFNSKMSLRFSDFKIWTGIFLCYRVKKNEFFTNLDLIIRKNLKISKNRARYLIFLDYRIRTPPIFKGKTVWIIQSELYQHIFWTCL